MSLFDDLKRASINIERDTDKKLRAVCLSLSNKVIQRTPVGNPDLWQSPPPPEYKGGTLRNAWRAAINSVSNDKGTAPDAGASHARGSVTSAISVMKGGDSFSMANNQPYAMKIEEGHSGQAPAGMVRITLAESGFDAERLMRG